MNQAPSQSRLTSLLFLLVMLLPVASQAQDPETEPVHWAYAAFLGTGWYELSKNRQVYVLRIPPRWNYRESSIDDTGVRQLGVEFHFPLTFGLHKLEQAGDLVDFDNIGTVSFDPGVEIEYPVTERWRLRAYGHLGWGKEHDSDESAWIYDAGLKSRYGFDRGKLDWAIINEIFVAGYDGKKTASDKLSGMLAGLDFSYPIGLGKQNALKLDWDIAYRWYENNPLFQHYTAKPVSIEDEWEIGLAIAKQDGPIKLWFMNFEHLGLVYRFNSDGSFRAVTVNFRSPFTR